MRKTEFQCALVVALLLGGCASQGGGTQGAPVAGVGAPAAATAAKPAVSAATAAPAAKPDEGQLREEGAFKRVVRGGKTLYCDNGPNLGSRLAKPRCLTEADYREWLAVNRATIDEMERGPRGPTVIEPGPANPAPR